MGMKEPHIQPPSFETYSDMPLFNTKAVVHQTGVPAPTLRAWERRYGILSPRRGENDYRLYSERDMATVAWLRERVASGMTISQAIALLRSLEPSRKRSRRGKFPQTFPPPEAAEPTSAQRVVAPMQSPPPLPTFSMGDISSSLIRQFMHLDEYSASRTIAQALAVFSVEEVCLSLFTPTLIEIGRMWADGEVSVTVEHFGSAIVRAQLESLYRTASATEQGPLFLVGCAPGELHELGAMMLALFLRRSGLRVAYLGQNVEIESLLSTVTSVRPSGILLSAALATRIEALTEVGNRLRQLPAPRPLYYFGGQAFDGQQEAAQRISGVFLRKNAYEAALEVKRRVTA